MGDVEAFRKLASRAAANLVAVAAISAIFGLKAFIDAQAAPPSEPPAALHATADVFAVNADQP